MCISASVHVCMMRQCACVDACMRSCVCDCIHTCARVRVLTWVCTTVNVQYKAISVTLTTLMLIHATTIITGSRCGSRLDHITRSSKGPVLRTATNLQHNIDIQLD